MLEHNSNNPRYRRPPLGTPPDFEKLDRAKAMHDARLEYTPITNFPDLVASFDVIIRTLNTIRAAVNATELSDDPSVIRLLKQSQWEQVREGWDDTPAIAHYDPLSGLVYARFDEAAYTAALTDKIFTAYTIAHELSHKATDGLEKYSYHLSEGMAEFLAQYTLENGALSPFIDKETLDHHRHAYLEQGPVVIDGNEFRAEDLFIVPSEKGTGFAYIPQLRIIQAINTVMSADQFANFLQSTVTGDTQGVHKILATHLSAKAVAALNDPEGKVNPAAVIADILS